MGRVDAQPSAGLEAERAVLGAMLIDESIVSQVLAEVDERDFTSTANRLIFQAAREVFREGGHADAITINAKLGYASGSPQQQQLIDLMEVTPTSASWREYAQLMREQAAYANHDLFFAKNKNRSYDPKFISGYFSLQNLKDRHQAIEKEFRRHSRLHPALRDQELTVVYMRYVEKESVRDL